MVDREAGGRFFRGAWIAGVHKHYPGTPKESYIKPWEEMDEWEQESAIAVYQQVAGVIHAGLHQERLTLTREQGGRLIRIAWVGQMYRYFREPKPAYVANWDEMSSQWEREVDMDIFEAIQQAILQTV
jgi:hypothetical protein